jgi:hypothetical protein
MKDMLVGSRIHRFFGENIDFEVVLRMELYGK